MSVFHLKYRPRKISDLDLKEVVESIKNILKTPEIPQSLLFAGPKGAGKTSAARIVARALNCEKPDDGEPCGECRNCMEILSGNSIDVMEIDAASNRGIEEARSLKEKAILAPSHLKWKVFIIDEVHMMTRDAFNALLKLIEEPPKNTIFILCTTDEEKIPDTVLSRLIRIGFYKGGVEELRRSIDRVVRGEGVEIDDEAISLMVKNSDGSFRNLHKTFTEIFLEHGKKINVEQVRSFFDKKNGDYSMESLELDLAAGSVQAILQKLEKMADNGANFKNFREKAILYFQQKMLAEYGVGDKSKSPLEAQRIEKWLQLLINAGKQEKDVFIDQLPIELAVVELLGEPKPPANSDIRKVEIPESPKSHKITPEAEAKPTEAVSKKVEAKLDINNSVEIGFGIDRIEAEWGKMLMTVKPFNHSVEAFLRSARPKELRGRVLTLEVFYPFHKDKLEEAKNRKIVEEGLLRTFGTEMIFECELGNGEKKPLMINNETPEKLVSENLTKSGSEGDIYDVAKEIFG